MVLERLHCLGRQPYFPAALGALGRGEAKAVALRADELLAHRERSALEVHVLPTQAQELALAQTGGEGEDIKRFEAVPLSHLEEPLGLFGGERVNPLLLRTRCVDGF